MRKLETILNDKITKQIKLHYPSAIVQKHADKFTSGIPDLEISIPVGVTCWIESKRIKNCVRGITLVSKTMVKPLQIEYLRERAELGIPCFIVVGRTINEDYYYAVYNPLNLPEKIVSSDFKLGLDLHDYFKLWFPLAESITRDHYVY